MALWSGTRRRFRRWRWSRSDLFLLIAARAAGVELELSVCLLWRRERSTTAAIFAFFSLGPFWFGLGQGHQVPIGPRKPPHFCFCYRRALLRGRIA